MHDVHRDSLIQKKQHRTPHTDKSRQAPEHGHKHDHYHRDENEHGHEHGQGHDDEHGHDHEHKHAALQYPRHDHSHGDEAYADHHTDLHRHEHQEHVGFEDRAYAHVHEHAHTFYHHHHHAHDPEHEGMVHRFFKDPARDWFGAALMVLLIAAGYYRWLPGDLSSGMLVCAAMIGLFPIAKNAVLDCISRRKITFELAVALVLAGGLVAGYYLEVALASLLLLAGSFMKLNFGWRKS